MFALLFHAGFFCFLINSLPLNGSSLVPGSLKTSEDETQDRLKIKKVLQQFYQSLYEEKSKAALKCLLCPKEMSGWVNAQVEYARTIKRWNRATKEISAKNRKPGSRPLNMSHPFIGLNERVKNTPLKIEGKLALLEIVKNNPLKLRKVDKLWKLDIYSNYERDSIQKGLEVTSADAALSILTEISFGTSKILNSIIDDIEAGKLSEPDAIRERLSQNLDDFMRPSQSAQK